MGKTKKLASTEPGSFRIGKRLIWSFRTFSTMACAMVIGYVTYYGTNVLGIPAGTIGLLILASKLVDAVSDLIGGWLVDRTNTKLGKARPYELSIIGLWASTVLMFSCPGLGLTGKCIWIFTWYTLVNDVFFTLLNAAEPVYMIRAIPNRHDMEGTASLNGITTILGAMIPSVVFPILMGTMGTQPGGWTMMALIFAVPMTLIGLLRFFFIPEVQNVQTEKKEKITVADLKLALTSNKYIYLYALLILVVNFLSGFTSSNTYYFDYIVGDVSMLGVASLPGMITPIMLLFFPLLLKKHSVVDVSKVCLVIGIIGCAMKQFAGANIGMILLGNLVAGIGTLPLSAFLVILLADTIDFNEWKTGHRVEGVYSSIGSFGQKIGTGLAAVISGFLLEAAGFISSEIRVEQPESAINMIRAQFGIIPGIFMIVALVVLIFFDVEKKMPQIHQELAERRGQANTEVQE